MSYYDDDYIPEYDLYSEGTGDPIANMAMGQPDQAAFLEYLMATGGFGPNGEFADINAPSFDLGQVQSMWGLAPEFQPNTGKPLTAANQMAVVGGYRSGMFDTLFQGLGGMDAFAADTFEPTVTTRIREEPELQQVYSYLRAPTSVEGIIAQELMTGGTPSSAMRNLRQMLTMSDEEVAAIFADYDEFFKRAEPTVTVENVARVKENLLLELPPMRDNNGMVLGEVSENGEGVNWDFGDDSVLGTAKLVNELSAQIPRLGPSGPQYAADGTMISPGGELQWGQDESGAPVMVEVTSTPSEAAQKFIDAGLPLPSDEYTASDFMSPETNEAFGLLGQVDAPVQAAMAAMMDPSLRPTNRETMTPYNEGYAPGWSEENAGGGGGGGPGTVGTTNAVLTGDRTGVPEYQAERGIWGTGTVPGIGTKAPVSEQEFNQIQDPAQWLDFYNRHANELTDDQRMEVIGNIMARGGPSQLGGQWDQVLDQVNQNMGVETEQGGGFEDININLPDIGRDENPIVTEANAITDPAAYRTFIEAHLGELRPSDIADLGERATTMGMTIATGRDMDAWSNVAGDLLGGDIAAGLPEGDLAAQGFAGTPRLNDALAADGSSKIAPRDYQGAVQGQTFWPQVPPPPRPPIEGGGALDPYLDNYTPTPPAPSAASMWPPSLIYDPWLQRQGAPPVPQQVSPAPDYATSGSDYRQQQAEAELEAMLRQILPQGGQPGPERPRSAVPGGTPPYVYGGSMPGPEQPRAAIPGGQPPYVYGGGDIAESLPAAGRWPPSILYDPWLQRQGAPPVPGDMGPPQGGQPGSILTQAAGGTGGQRTQAMIDALLAENLSNYAVDPTYQAPPGGYPTLDEAAQAGSPAAISYFEEHGPSNEQLARRNAPQGLTPGSILSDRGTSPTPEMTNQMVAQLVGGNAPTSLQGPLTHDIRGEAGLHYVYGPGGGPLPPGGGNRYTTEPTLRPIETGEGRAAQRQEDERNAQVLGGSTDRTGRRVRPTRTGEQARQFRAAMDTWHSALDQRNAVMNASWGSPEFGPAVAQEIQMRRQGVRPLDQALMARRLVLMGAGMPSSGYLPGT